MNKEWKQPKIIDGVPTEWGWIVKHSEHLILGENTDIGAFTYIQAECGIEIGKNVQVGSHCSIYSKNTIDNTHSKIIIEDNVKIGAGSVVLPRKDGEPLIIGVNAKVGALSLVRDDIPSNSTYAGIPAKPIKEGDFYVKRKPKATDSFPSSDEALCRRD